MTDSSVKLPGGIDIAFDMSGSADAMENSLDTLAIGGTAVWIGAAFGEPLPGYAIDVTGDTNSIFIVISLLCLLSALSVSAVRRFTGFSLSISKE